jgi:predicted glycoside hydrolase/deacetylase ChbG (UPF0249 family)
LSKKARRFLIVNADDFGRTSGVNRGIARAHEEGIVTSASLMVSWPAAAEAAAYGRAHPDLSIGLHVDLGEWAYRTDQWMPVYEFDPLNDRPAVKKELARQLSAFRDLTGRDPTHLDSHQHVHHDQEPVSSLLLELAGELDVPLRHYHSEVQYCGAFYGQTPQGAAMPQAISVESLISILADLPAGVTELACHPGEPDDLESTYREERAKEVEALCDPRVREALALERIELRSFHTPDGRWPSD